MELTPFQKWYADNREQFNQRRAERRRNDPQYAEKQRQYKRKNTQPDPEDGLTLTDLAQELQTTIWVLNGWLQRRVMPTPLRYKGSLWVHRHNLPLLRKVQEYFEHHPRTTETNKGTLEDLVNWVFANWMKLEAPNGTERQQEG